MGSPPREEFLSLREDVRHIGDMVSRLTRFVGNLRSEARGHWQPEVEHRVSSLELQLEEN